VAANHGIYQEPLNSRNHRPDHSAPNGRDRAASGSRVHWLCCHGERQQQQRYPSGLRSRCLTHPRSALYGNARPAILLYIRTRPHCCPIAHLRGNLPAFGGVSPGSPAGSESHPLPAELAAGSNDPQYREDQWMYRSSADPVCSQATSTDPQSFYEAFSQLLQRLFRLLRKRPGSTA
jgi:hypothetical protein